MKDTLTSVCMVLWPHRGSPHPALRLLPSEAAFWIIVGWDRKALDMVPKWAKLAICKIAITVPYEDEVMREVAVVWACQEASYWWNFLHDEKVTINHLKMLMHQYVDSGRI